MIFCRKKPKPIAVIQVPVELYLKIKETIHWTETMHTMKQEYHVICYGTDRVNDIEVTIVK